MIGVQKGPHRPGVGSIVPSMIIGGRARDADRGDRAVAAPLVRAQRRGAKIRRLHFTEGKGIKTICRDLKLSKKVVRKVIRTGITEFTYTRTVQPRPKLSAWLGEPNRLLEVNAARASRERQSLTQIYEVEGLPATGSRAAPTERSRL